MPPVGTPLKPMGETAAVSSSTWPVWGFVVLTVRVVLV